jgi:TIR domain
MTEASGSVDPGARPGWRWDVALSFAGARRDYVDQVAQVLKARGVRCFYDADEEIELWGKYLAEELPAIYGEQAAAVVIFVSAEYAARDWTRHERRAALGRAVRERREYVLPARFDDTPLPGLQPDVSYVDLRGRTPQQFAAMIAAKLASLGISPSSPGEAGRGPPGGISVSEAAPRRLGVHATISVPGVPDEVPPEYVPRDVDAAEHGVRARVAAAAERGGFVLLVGGSSVGKTRCAVEAVKALLPDWWLVHPAGPGEVAALAAAPSPRLVVWLDELQRYLDGEHGLSGGMLRALLDAPHPTVIIGTLWPDRYAAYMALPAPGGADLHAREREVLDLAAVIRISPAEQDRAHAAASRDRRLRVALETAGYGLTQTLAAAPQLVARWQDAQTVDPYAWAVLTAALDAARLGARAPLSADLLRAAAPGYCTSQQQAEAPDDWFEKALAYATGKLHGAAAALSPAGAGMGQVAGYTAADYLIHHASRERGSARVPASTWDAILSHIGDPADAARLAVSAKNRMLYRYAFPLYRHAADGGDRDAAFELAWLLADRGDLDGAIQLLQAPADAGDGWAASQLARLLARLLARRGDLDALRARADAGDGPAASELAGLLADRGDLDALRARADTGDKHAARRLAMLLASRGDLDQLRARADAGDRASARLLAMLLASHGDQDEAMQLLRARADARDGWAASWLADLLKQRGDLDELRARADARDGYAARRLAELLTERGDLDELRARADAGDYAAAELLTGLLADRGDLDGLRARADAGDGWAATRLTNLLAERLTNQGRGEEAGRLRWFGLNPDGSIAGT